MLKQKPSQYVFGLLSLALLIFVAYRLGRHETTPLFLCYAGLFLLYIRQLQECEGTSEARVSYWIVIAVIFRAALLFSMPALSDDFYRFIWDGRVLAAGANPYSEVPAYYMSAANSLPGLDPELYANLNSKERFSSYPPVCQLIYWLSAIMSPDSVQGSVVAMKHIIFLFEIGTIWILKELISYFQLPRESILIYALNPLVVLEIAGNLHFEGIMIFFLMSAIWLLTRGQTLVSAVAFALSVCTKLIPLIFLPLLYYALGWKKAVRYWIVTGIATTILFLPLLNAQIVPGFSTSLQYYFQRFEFNASLYYLIRELGYQLFGFNIIQYAGPALALAAMALILYLAFKRYRGLLSGGINEAFFQAMMWSLFIYFLSTTTLHPWYIITLIAISVFTKYRFPLIWSGLIFLSYAGYTKTSFEENLLVVALEYGVLFIYLSYETIWTRRIRHS